MITGYNLIYLLKSQIVTTTSATTLKQFYVVHLSHSDSSNLGQMNLLT